MSDFTKFLYRLDVIFVRHAESSNNKLYEKIRSDLGPNATIEEIDREELKRRHPDCGLSELGVIQKQLLQEYASKNGWEVDAIPEDFKGWEVHSSPMKRCLLTAGAIANAFGKNVIVNPMLHEAGGSFHASPDGSIMITPGATAREIEEEYPGYICLPGMENGWWYGKETKESEKCTDARSFEIASGLWNKLLDQTTNSEAVKGVVIVSHGNILSGIVNCLVTQSKAARSSMFIHENTGYTHVELYYDSLGGRKAVGMKTFNGTGHLSKAALHSGGHTVRDFWIQDFYAKDEFK